MEITVTKTSLEEIQPFRHLFLQENHFQFVYNKCHLYGWADTWLFWVDGIKAGYGAVWGENDRADRDAIFEFYITMPFRQLASRILPAFHAACGASIIECQSNDALLASMLYEFAQNIYAEAILFEEHYASHLVVPGASFGRKPVENNSSHDMGGYFLELDGEEAASGGFMLNYNLPYADIYMEVKEAFRGKGLGSFLVQELKKEIYRMGRLPAARCNIHNQASKAALLKAGFRVCGAILKGTIRQAIVS